jgi:hypothetical protein
MAAATIAVNASPLEAGVHALRQDLIHEDGPRISTMRNYRFAILQYEPREEFKLRGLVQGLALDLEGSGWAVLSIDLHRLFLDRVRAQGSEWVERVVAMERTMTAKSHERGLNYLRPKLEALIDGPDGIAADCAKVIAEYTQAHPDRVDRTLALVGRAGALFPFFRSSALLRHLDGRTGNVPVVLLYPGTRGAKNGLSFMGALEPDHDYRPRIYP